MEGEIARAIVEVIPFGEGGAEIGMTRAEMHEHMDNLFSVFGEITNTILQLVFAWLIGMFFVAHRLSMLQLFVATSFFGVFYFQAWSQLLSVNEAYGRWFSLAYTAEYRTASSSDQSWIARAVHALNYTGTLWEAMPFVMFAVCIWWAFSCRGNQTKEHVSAI